LQSNRESGCNDCRGAVAIERSTINTGCTHRFQRGHIRIYERFESVETQGRAAALFFSFLCLGAVCCPRRSFGARSAFSILFGGGLAAGWSKVGDSGELASSQMLPHLFALWGLTCGVDKNNRAAHAHASHDHVTAVEIIDELGFGAGLGRRLGPVAAPQLTVSENQK
jgi:hypothetical protein